MNQLEIGLFIAKKRKEQSLTQAQLAEKLGISNKTISKWETGKCMPDYGIIQPLCKELGISVSELIDGEEAEPDSIRSYDEAQVLDLLRRIQNLEKQKVSLYGILLITMGTALFAAHFSIGGSSAKDFFSAVLLGLAIAETLVGIFVAVIGFSNQNRNMQAYVQGGR